LALDLDLLSKALALAGFGLLLWPSIQRLRGAAPGAPGTSWARIKSPLWWAGLVLVCVALMLQRLAHQGG